LPNADYQKAGVYLIKSLRTGNIVYIGHSSSNLKKTLYRHFQEWNERQKQRITYGKYAYEIRVIYTTPTRAPQIEKFLIQKFKPRDNENFYENDTVKDFTNDLDNKNFFLIDIDEELPF
jgi:excinuclease UvrABC nuclease subunit